MKEFFVFGDERVLGSCAFCGGATETRDHCPSRVLLDEPYPENLPVVGSCLSCNAGFSKDEEYLACLLACTLAGSTEPAAIKRENVRRILEQRPALRDRLERARSARGGRTEFAHEPERVNAVITKLAQGHAFYELHEPRAYPPANIEFRPLHMLDPSVRDRFERPLTASGMPEVGSRAMHRLFRGDDTDQNGWVVVQAGRYRYHAVQDGGVGVRIVLSEYLACEVRWDD